MMGLFMDFPKNNPFGAPNSHSKGLMSVGVTFASFKEARMHSFATTQQGLRDSRLQVCPQKKTKRARSLKILPYVYSICIHIYIYDIYIYIYDIYIYMIYIYMIYIYMIYIYMIYIYI